MPETKDLILRHPDQEDWRDMYRNLWRHPESARFMLWDVTQNEEDARARMARTIAFQAGKPLWTVFEKKSGQAIGFGGIEVLSKTLCCEAGIAIGPDFVGQGYGKQILNALTEYAKTELGAEQFQACCRKENGPSRGMILGCGFRFTHTEEKTDPRDGSRYIIEYYIKEL